MKYLWDFLKYTLALLLLFGAGCTNRHVKDQYGAMEAPPVHDALKNLTKEDYDALVNQRAGDFTPVKPRPKKVPPPNPWPKKTVSLDITPQADLQAVFDDITQQVGIGVRYKDLKNKKGYVYRVHRRPVEEVVTTLCDFGSLRCVLKNGVLSIEPDTPYYVTYDLQFIASKRSDEGHIAISTDIFSLPFGRKGQSNYENGSSSRLKTEVKTDFWEELNTVLQTILFAPDTVISSQTWQPVAWPKNPGPESPQGPLPDGNPLGKGKPSPPMSALEAPKITPIKMLPVQQQKKTLPYAMHKQAGLLTVYGTAKQQELIYSFLERLKRKATAQVLIEAKVIEVGLNDQFSSGINWRSIFSGDVNFAAPLGAGVNAVGAPFATNATAASNYFTLTAAGNKFSALLKMIESFGTVRTLSNPRITVVNNQPAVLKVAENKVYFQVKYDRKLVTDGNGNVSFSDIFASESQINTIPIGFVMAVLPAVDVDNDEVILTLRPSITRTTSSVTDPAVSIVNSTVSSSVPVVEVREMDSVMRLSSGQIAILGGLMQDRVQNTDTSVPGLSDIPIFGGLFKGKEDVRVVTELVIFLQATILHDDSPIQAVTNADQRLYTKFIEDPRPLDLQGDQNAQTEEGAPHVMAQNVPL